MIGYSMIGTNDIDRSRRFYEALVKILGGDELRDISTDRQSWFRGLSRSSTPFAIVKTYDGAPAAPGNGNMLALVAMTRDLVDAAYAKALELGAKDEGAPGIRGSVARGFYAAYFRDPDGNKLCVYRTGP